MVKIYSISVLAAPPSQPSTVLATASDLSQFSFYQKGSVAEFLAFFGRTVVDRTPQGQRHSVQENNYTAHVYNRGGAEQLAGKLVNSITHKYIRLCSNLSTLTTFGHFLCLER